MQDEEAGAMQDRVHGGVGRRGAWGGGGGDCRGHLTMKACPAPLRRTLKHLAEERASYCCTPSKRQVLARVQVKLFIWDPGEFDWLTPPPPPPFLSLFLNTQNRLNIMLRCNRTTRENDSGEVKC